MNQKTDNKDSRQAILGRLRNSDVYTREDKTGCEIPDGIVFPGIPDLLLAFKTELESLSGEVILCNGSMDVAKQLHHLTEERSWNDLSVVDQKITEFLASSRIKHKIVDPGIEEVEVGVTRCEALIALTGGVMVSSKGGSGRRMNVFPTVHIVLAHQSQLVESIADGFDLIAQKYDDRPSQISLISGPSRTADIEKTLVMGAHGPKELIVLIDQEQ